jgi:hypothetical protein
MSRRARRFVDRSSLEYLVPRARAERRKCVGVLRRLDAALEAARAGGASVHSEAAVVAPGIYTPPALMSEVDAIRGRRDRYPAAFHPDPEVPVSDRRFRTRYWWVYLALFIAIALIVFSIFRRPPEPEIQPSEVTTPAAEPRAAVAQLVRHDEGPSAGRHAMTKQLSKALHDAFDAHEEHRGSIAKSRVAARKARDADERVRQLRRLERERQASRTRRSRAA